MKTNLLNFSFILLYVGLNASGALMIKNIINQKGAIPLNTMRACFFYFCDLFTNPIVILSLCFIFMSALAWMAALSRLNIAIAYPIAISLNFILVLSVAILSFKEPFNLKQALAILMILSSIILLYK